MNPHNDNILKHLGIKSRTLGIHSSRYNDIILLGDFNASADEETMNTMKNFCTSYGLTSLIKQPSCFKQPEKPSCTDHIFTNRSRYFQSTFVVETGSSDFHRTTMETLRKWRRLEVAVISTFFRSTHAQMRRFSRKPTSCWKRLLQNWCFRGVLTLVEKYGREKVNNQPLLLNSAYVVVFIMSSNFPLYSSN